MTRRKPENCVLPTSTPQTPSVSSMQYRMSQLALFKAVIDHWGGDTTDTTIKEDVPQDNTPSTATLSPNKDNRTNSTFEKGIIAHWGGEATDTTNSPAPVRPAPPASSHLSQLAINRAIIGHWGGETADIETFPPSPRLSHVLSTSPEPAPWSRLAINRAIIEHWGGESTDMKPSPSPVISTTSIGPPISNPTTADASLTLITTTLLIPGRGNPTPNAVVVTSSKTKKILFVGPHDTLPSKYAHLPPTHVPVLLPGLWDCHCHCHGGTSLNLTPIATTHPATAGARLARSAADTLAAGFTSVRELGGYAPEIASAIAGGIIPGPHLYSAGAAISQTAGHGDLFDLPVGWVWQCQGVSVGVSALCVADGVEECRKAVRLQIRRGAKVIKVFASGGVLSIADNPLYQQFSDDELGVIVEEATRAHLVVAAHVHGKEGIMAALRAGVKTIEHGTWLDEEAMELMKEKGAILVATRTIVKEAVKNKDLLSPESAKKLTEVAKQSDRMYAVAIKAKVKIALGTDLGISTPGNGVSHGNNGGEFAYAVESGMTPLEAIEAGTAMGPETLGPQGPKSGLVREGWDADLIAVVKSPLEDIGVLGSAANVSHVWKGGILYKKP